METLNKIMWAIGCFIIVVGLYVVIFDDDDSSESQKQEVEQVKEQPAEQPAKKPDFLGTYSVRDKSGIVYHFVIKEDKTVDVYSSADKPNIRQLWVKAKWEWEGRYGIQIQFDKYHIPNFVYQNGEKSSICAYICGGYYYPDFFTCDDKDEYYRLAASKIN